MASVASYYSDNLREEVLKGMNQKAEQGWFPGLAPFGYSNERKDDGKAIIVPNPEQASKVTWLFETFATERLTIDGLQDRARCEGIYYSDMTERFPRNTIYRILTNPFYVGRFKRHGIEYQGKHEPIIPESLFNRVQQILGGSTYRKHTTPYAGSLLSCSYCGSAVTGEVKTKKNKEWPERLRVLPVRPLHQEWTSQKSPFERKRAGEATERSNRQNPHPPPRGQGMV
jgi:hypothetical protein